MSLETWVSIGTLLGVAGGLFLAMRSMGAELRKEIGTLRTDLKGDIAGLRTELKGDIAELRTELKGDIARLDDRVYALAAGLRPQLDPTADRLDSQ